MRPQEQRVERRLAAIFAADVAGYSRLMSQDEAATLRALADAREIMDSLIAEHGGRIANTAGDSVLAEFPSAVHAVQCAVALQERLAAGSAGVPDDRRLRFRIGIHLGDVAVRGSDLLGDGVNLAARLEGLAEPGGVCLSEAVHAFVRKALPLAYTDLGEQYVKGFDEPVRAYVARPAAAVPASSAPKPLPLPDKPSIAVLPFTNMSGDPEQEYFADGVVEEIIAALSRIRSFFVIARNSTFTYKGKAIDIRQVSRELGVRYVLEGSVRRASRRVRVTAQLIDGTDASHAWADRFDSEIEDIFDLQDQLTSAIVGAIQPSIRSHEVERARRKRPDSLDAYDYLMRALPTVWSNEPDDVARGLVLVEKAMERDPTYALARAIGSWCHAQQVIYLRSANPAEDRDRALRLAQEAARLDSDDPLVLTILSAAYTLVKRLDLASSLIEKALVLDPNSAWAWQRSGWLRMYMGEAEVSIDHFQRGLRLSPLDPLNFNSYVGIGAAHALAYRYDKAIEAIEKALRDRPDAVWAYRTLGSAYANAGRLDEARACVAKLLRAYPDLTARHLSEVIPANQDYMTRYIEGLRKAGLPE